MAFVGFNIYGSSFTWEGNVTQQFKYNIKNKRYKQWVIRFLHGKPYTNYEDKKTTRFDTY